MCIQYSKDACAGSHLAVLVLPTFGFWTPSLSPPHPRPNSYFYPLLNFLSSKLPVLHQTHFKLILHEYSFTEAVQKETAGRQQDINFQNPHSCGELFTSTWGICQMPIWLLTIPTLSLRGWPDEWEAVSKARGSGEWRHGKTSFLEWPKREWKHIHQDNYLYRDRLPLWKKDSWLNYSKYEAPFVH